MWPSSRASASDAARLPRMEREVTMMPERQSRALVVCALWLERWATKAARGESASVRDATGV